MIEKYLRTNDDADVMKGIIAGVAGGLLASLVMEQFQFVWNKASAAIWRASEEEKPKGRKPEPATVKAAQSISKAVFGKSLPKSRKRLAGEAVHYAVGTASAAVYGALSEAIPVATVGDGLVFGTAVWLLADEVTAPALGLSKAPSKYPLSTHAYALVSHLVYGWTTEMVRRAVRKAL
jgi:putative membrane protein